MSGFPTLTLMGLLAMSASASVLVPASGWNTQLSTDFHDVSGTVTILGETSLKIENFTYDGQGIDVYFYLASEDSTSAFLSGLEIGPQLFGTVFDGSGPDIVIDLPVGESTADYCAISVWCTAAGVSFGSGTFQEAVPEPGVAVLAAGGLSLLARRRRAPLTKP